MAQKWKQQSLPVGTLVQAVVALLAGVLGAILAVSGIHVVIGTVLSVVGAAGVSWVFSDHFARAAGAKHLQDQMAIVAQTLNLTDGRVRRTLETYAACGIDGGELSRTIEHLNGAYRGQIEQLIRLTDRAMDNTTMAINVRDMGQAAEIVDSLIDRARQGTGTDDVVQDLERLASYIETEKSRTLVRVRCAACETIVTAQIAAGSGQTASVVCPSCGIRLNVHTDGKGRAFARPYRSRPQAPPPSRSDRDEREAGGAVHPSESGTRGSHETGVGAPILSPSDETPVAPEVNSPPRCAHCGRRYWTSLRPTRVKQYVCLRCDWMSEIGPVAADDREVAAYTRVEAKVVGGTRSVPHLECPSCGEPRWSQLRDDEHRYAYCSEDRKLLFATGHAVEEAAN